MNAERHQCKEEGAGVERQATSPFQHSPTKAALSGAAGAPRGRTGARPPPRASEPPPPARAAPKPPQLVPHLSLRASQTGFNSTTYFQLGSDKDTCTSSYSSLVSSSRPRSGLSSGLSSQRPRCECSTGAGHTAPLPLGHRRGTETGRAGPDPSSLSQLTAHAAGGNRPGDSRAGEEEL